MKQWFFLLLVFFIPTLALADGFDALNFTPPGSDVSVEFLADLFGNVEGVLSGTGSQIVGKMFAVLNSAVLALAGLLVAYTLIVSTMNTAHEGEILGKKWSSIWIPIRVSLGLALLLPRASGYCSAQILVMWIVVQGVGAGDKIWNAALDYLGTGGVVISQSADTQAEDNGSNSGINQVNQAAGGVLAGQLCMLAMEYQYKRIWDIATDDSSSSPRCENVSVNNSSSNEDFAQYAFCNYSVPDFTSSVSFTSDDIQTDVSGRLYVYMPYFTTSWSQSNDCPSGGSSCTEPSDANVFYSKLNGVCGVIAWNDMSGQGNDEISGSELNDSIAVAVAQLYSSMLTTAQMMVDASPFSGTTFTSSTTYSSFGLPTTPKEGTCDPDKNSSAVSCTGTNATQSCDEDYQDSSACLSWGGLEGVGTLLNGTEITDAVDVFIGLMSPSMRLLSMDSSEQSNFEDLTAFISSAESQGWILAGSYFFNLANLNDFMVSDTSSTSDLSEIGITTGNGCPTSTGTSRNTYAASSSKYAAAGISCTTDKTGQYAGYITTLVGGMSVTDVFKPVRYLVSPKVDNGYTGNSGDPITNLPTLPVTGTNLFQKETSVPPDTEDPYAETASSGGGLTKRTFCYSSYPDVIVLSNNSSYVPTSPVCVGQLVTNSGFAFYNNANAYYIPETNTDTPTFSLTVNIAAGDAPIHFDNISVSGGSFGIPGDVVEWIMNKVVIPFMNQIMDAIASYLSTILMVIITPPLKLLSGVFDIALEQISNPNVNPVVSLAAMGSTYISGIANLWYIVIIPISLIAAMAGGMAGAAVLVLLALTLPIVMAWYAVMFAVGCLCAYYIPFMPYMVFTFASIGWFIGVIEAMAAAPLVALGVATPEGHEAFGKSAQAIMIILNVFLRPGLMIIGYILGFSLSYVGIWLVNAGFTRVQTAMWDLKMPSNADGGDIYSSVNDGVSDAYGYYNDISDDVPGYSSMSADSSYEYCSDCVYYQWSSIFFYFFLVLIYTTMMIVVVQKSYELIHILPDKILRWLSGGHQESLGSESAGMIRDVKQQAESGASKSWSGLEESAGATSKALGDASGGGGGGGGGGASG